MSSRISLPPISSALEPMLPWIGEWVQGKEGQAPVSDVGILKHSALRLVLRIPEPSRGSVILKLYRRKGIVEALRSTWLRSRSLREKKVLIEAGKRGLPCPQVLDAGHAAGMMPDLGWLVLEDLGEGCDLDLIHRTRGLDESELHACADLLQRALAQGLQHRDLHLGNLYLTATGSLFLLDLHSARFGAHAHEPGLSEFRPLYLSFAWPEQLLQRRVLFGRLGLPADPPALVAWRKNWLERRLERCLRDSGQFTWRNAMGQRRDCHWTGVELRDAMDQAEVLKTGRRGSVLRSALGIHKIRKSGRSLQLWLASEALALRDVPHPKALAWMPISGGRGSILCEDLMAGRPLGEIRTEEASYLAEDLGRSFGRLHGSGWRFRDARGDNFLVLNRRVHLVDLDGCGPLPGLRPEAACSADLGRLLAWVRYQAPASLREQSAHWGRRFLQSYVRHRRRLDGKPSTLRSLCDAIALRSDAWQESHK